MNKKNIKKLFLFVVTVGCLFFLTAENDFVSNVQAKAASERQMPELVLQTGHSASVDAVVFGAGGDWLATAGFDNTVKIWDVKTGRELRTLNGHTGAVKALAVSSDGKWLASGGNDRSIRVWDVVTGQEIRQIPAHESAIETLAFSPDGKFLASGGADTKIKIWNVYDWREITLAGHQAWVTALAFSPDGKLLASGGSDNLVKIWDAEKGKELRSFKKHAEKVKSLAFSGDGQLLASGALDAAIKVWNVKKNKEIAAFDGLSGAILALRFTPESSLQSASADGSLKLWDVQQKREIKKPGSSNKNPEDDSPAVSAAFNLDGKTVAFGGGDSAIALFDAERQKETQILEAQTSGIKAVAISRSGNLLAAGGTDHSVKIWDLQTGQELPSLIGHNGYVTGVAVSPDGQRVYSSSIDGTIRVWNLTDSRRQIEPLIGHKGKVQAIAINQAGNLLASAGDDATVKLWNLETNRELYSLGGHEGEVTTVAFSDQNTIAAGGVDRKVLLWDAEQRKFLRSFEADSAIVSTAFSPDGKLLAAGCADKIVRVWETATGKLLKTFNNSVGALAFAPDNIILYLGGQDQTLRKWNLATNEETVAPKAQDENINSLALDSTGDWLFSASGDGSLILWNAKKLTKAATLVALRTAGEWLTVAPDGTFDGSETAWDQILWRFGKNTFNVKPVEVFWSEFFRPGLLADLLQGKGSGQISDISEKDRRQPQLKIALLDDQRHDLKTTIASRQVKVRVEVEEAAPGEGFATGSGARDVRLFRNGSLVEFWAGDVIKKGVGKIVLETEVNLVAGANQITAYAFNHDNIKSGDAVLNLTGAENLRRRGKAYIIAIGVGRSENPRYNLSFVENDAAAVENELREKQSQLKLYEKVEVAPLLNEAATKENILAAIGKLAGFDPNKTANKLPAEINYLQKAEPEDTVIVYFSGHGTRRDGHFYMIPHDIGYRGSPGDPFEQKTKQILARSISDVELEKVFRRIDAKNILLIIDACYSGQAIDADNERQGPTNAKGLAQLAYDKGMSILTASQSSEVAYVSKSLKFSYLTFALIEEGLKTSLADKKPADNRISIREWFDYAAWRVPELREETARRSAAPEQNKDLIEEEPKQVQTMQRPRVFYRRQIDSEPFVIAQLDFQKK